VKLDHRRPMSTANMVNEARATSQETPRPLTHRSFKFYDKAFVHSERAAAFRLD
jgi:hypothetical protein